MSKKKILMISDDIRCSSGVGIQSKYFAEALVESGKYQVLNLAGALHHPDPRPVKFEKYGDDLLIIPVDKYGDQNIVRNIIHDFKPDALWIMTDPRFWTWLWQIEQEIRPLCPIVYYHVWDNYPYPKFNRPYYLSNDKIVTISKVTDDIVRTVTPEVDCTYLPHTVDSTVFKPMSDEEVAPLLSKDGKFTFFWISRNAHRKLPANVIWWFADFLNEVGHDKARLIMHTDARDEHGFDLEKIAIERGLTRDNFLISNARMPPQELAKIYNAADCTINLSFAEGFGVGILESLACGTPVIVNMTGGLQDQVTDGTEWFGIGIKPATKSLAGGLGIVPFIYEDRVAGEDVVAAMKKMLSMTRAERKALGMKGRQHFEKNFSMESYRDNWVKVMDEVIEKNGSWDNRKNYTSYTFEEIK